MSNFHSLRFQLACLTLLGLGHRASAQTAGALDGGDAVNGERAGPICIPMDSDSGRPQVPVMFGEHGPFRFAIDTAAGTSAIDERLAQRLNLAVIGRAAMGDATGNARRAVDIVQWDSVRMGGLVTFEQGAANAVDLSRLRREGDGFDGILGFGVFRDYLLTLDYPGRVIVLEQGELPPADGREVFDYELEEDIPQIVARLAGVPLALCIDSGMQSRLTVADSLRKSFPTRSPPKAVYYGTRINSVEEVAAARIAGDLAIGRHTFSAPVVEYGGERSLIGHEVLKHFVVTFDQRHRRVRFARVETDAIPSAPICGVGFRLVREGGSQVIERVIRGSPAAEAKLRPRDRIVEVNGKPAAEITRAVFHRLTHEPGEVRLGIERRGRRRDVTLQVRVVVE